MVETDILWVKEAKYLDGYRILVVFSDDVQKIVDLEDCLDGEIFEPLKDIEKFKQFNLSDWTVEWENGADLAPEYLYEIGE